MKTPPEALPCPFCGHIGLNFDEGSTFRWMVASCGGCGATRGDVRVQTLGEGTKEQWWEAAKIDAIEDWNQRAALAAPPLQVPQADIMRKLQDPTLVHVAMIRGEIATPDIRTFLHAHGEEALAQWDRGAAAPIGAPPQIG